MLKTAAHLALSLVSASCAPPAASSWQFVRLGDQRESVLSLTKNEAGVIFAGTISGSIWEVRENNARQIASLDGPVSKIVAKPGLLLCQSPDQLTGLRMNSGKVQEWSVPFSSFLWGFETSGDRIVSADAGKNKLFVIRPEDGTVEGAFSLPEIGEFNDIANVGDSQLIAGSGKLVEVRATGKAAKVLWQTERGLSSLQVVGPDVYGIELDGKKLTYSLVQVDPKDGTVRALAELPNGIPFFVFSKSRVVVGLAQSDFRNVSSYVEWTRGSMWKLAELPDASAAGYLDADGRVWLGTGHGAIACGKW